MKPAATDEGAGHGALRWYWLFPALVAAYAMIGSQNTPGFVWWALLAAVAVGIPLLATRHDALSIVAIIALSHALFYPLGVVLNLVASAPGVYEVDLWEATPAAMRICAIGMLGLALGAWLGRRHWRARLARIPRDAGRAIRSVGAWRILPLWLLVVPLALFKLYTGTYFHTLAAGDIGWNESNALMFGAVGYLEYVVYAGMFLQIRHYVATRSRRDLWIAVAAVVIPMMIMLPSGSREAALKGPAVVVFLCLAGFSSRLSLKAWLTGLALAVSVLFMMMAVEFYRGRIYYELKSVTWSDRFHLLMEGMEESLSLSGEDWDRNLQLWSRRFSDYVAVGYIVKAFPAVQDFRWFEDVGYWPIYLLPSPIRPPTPDFDARDSANLAYEVGFLGGTTGGSSPSMILGDLYSRFYWPGVFLGMTLLGALFTLLDMRMKRFALFETILFAMLFLPLMRLPQASLLEHFIFFTRNLAITYAMALALAWYCRFGAAQEASRGVAPRDRSWHSMRLGGADARR